MSIELKNAGLTYMRGTALEKAAVHDITFTLGEGELAALAGHTGSGKSTLIQMLSGLLVPTSGEVTLDGVSLFPQEKSKRSAARAARSRVGMVFQYPEQQLFEETVAKDVAFGPTNQGLGAEEIEKRVREALKLVGLSYEEFGGKSPFSLSGGEKRRAAIAGVLALQPDYLVLDEPMAGLDPRGREEFISMLEGLRRSRKGFTVLLVSHDMDDILRLASRLLVLKEGALVADGRPEEIFADRELLLGAGLRPPRLFALMERLRAEGLAAKRPVKNIDDALRAIGEGMKHAK